MPRPKQTQFQFVNIETPEQSGHVETRKLVRRHVMQQHLQKRLEEQRRDREFPNDISTGDSTACNSPTASLMCNCFGNFAKAVAKSKETGKLLSIEECTTCRRSRLRTAESSAQAIATRPHSPAKDIDRLGSGRADPFGTYAIEMSSYMHGLLDHSESETERHQSIIPEINAGTVIVMMTPAITLVETKYGSRTHFNKSFKFMISDSAVLHSSLAVASMHSDFCQGHRRLTYRTVLHRGEAIRLVNEMLQDKTRAISDEMVACMVRLSTFESFSGDHQGWRSHADGLVEIVRRRRGLQSLDYVERQCNEIDVMGAMVDGTRPRFSPVPETDLVPLSVFPIDELTLDSTTVALLVGTGFARTITNPMLAQTLRNMRGLLIDLLDIEDSGTFPPEMVLFTKKRTFIEYPLLSLPFTHLALSPLEDSIRLAGIIFSNCVFRNYPPSSDIHVSLLMQLQASLSFFNPSLSNAILWIAVTAGSVTTYENPALRSYFGALLRSVCEELGIHAWHECKEVLETFLWHRGRFDDAASTFWIEESIV
ncbi:hypothetical protein MMC11_007082 [Xylographa trunciseda]|nr:hypothetical protein [Xylographa trunciseda]